jgi:general secretion pathway protein F
MATSPRPPRATLSSLSWQVRADLFAQLAAMEKSGLPTIQAFGHLRLPPQSQPRVAAARKLLARGTTIADAGRSSGLFTELEANLIDAAASAGSPAPTYRRLADYYTQRAMQARAVRSRLPLPGFLLLAGLFLQPLPALVSGSLSGGRYLLHCLSPLVAIAALVYLGSLLFKQQEGPPSPVRSAIELIALHTPLFGNMLVRSNIRDFFESLALMAEAGMPILQAVPKALDTIRLGAVKAAFGKILPKLTRGSTLAQSLAQIPYLDNGQALALIGTGEASGTLPEMLFRFAAMETESINAFNRQVADWLPRIVYAAVACWVAYGLLSGPGIGTQMPEELR